MPDYFANLQNARKLLAEARSWEGTPFHPHARLKGRGVDCVNLPLGIFQAIGFLGQVDLPRYTMDGGSHLDASQLTAFIQSLGCFRAVNRPDEPLLAGDLLAMKLGRVEHHLGLYLYGARFLHVFRRQPVCECDIEDPAYARHITQVFRAALISGHSPREIRHSTFQ